MTSQNSNMDNSFSCSTIFSTNFDTNTDYENLRIIFEDVLGTVAFANVEDNVFVDEIPKLKSCVLEVVNKIRDSLKSDYGSEFVLAEIKDLLNTYLNLLKLLQNAVQYIGKKVEFSLVPSLPLAVTEILFETFQHCKESDTIYGDYFTSLTDSLTALFKKANEIQSNLINLINNLLIFDLSDEQQLHILVEVVGLFSAIGQIVSSLDIKTTAEIWKAYIVVSQTYNDVLKTKVNIEETLKYHCKEITVGLENIMKSSDIKFIEKTLKISSFNLKIIIKLCNLYCDNLGNPYISLFDLLISLNRYSVQYLHLIKKPPKVIDFIQMYVGVGAEPLLTCLIEDRQFIQVYFKNINQQFVNNDLKLSAIILTISILKKTLNLPKNPWVSELDNNLINIIVSNIEKLHVELSSDLQINLPQNPGESNKPDTLYSHILIYTTTIIISLNNAQFKNIQKLLIRSLLQTNVWKSVFIIDVWCILARYANPEFGYDQLQLLIIILLSLKQQNRPEKHYLSNLINRLYQLLSIKHKVNLQKLYPITEYPEIWTAIGLPDAFVTDTISLTGNKIDNFLKTQGSSSQFKTMCDFLELLTTTKTINMNELIVQQFANRVIKLWGLNFNTDIKENGWFLRFVGVRTKITNVLITLFNNHDVLMVLRASSELNETSITSKCVNTVLLKSLAPKLFQNSPEQFTIFTYLTNLFKVLLKDANSVIRQMTLEAFSHFAYVTKHEVILANVVDADHHLQQEISNYLQKIVKPDVALRRTQYLGAQTRIVYRHKCIEIASEPAQKKKKLIHITEIIERLRRDCDSIVEYTQNDAIPSECTPELNAVVTNLQKILNNCL